MYVLVYLEVLALQQYATVVENPVVKNLRLRFTRA